MAVAQSYPGPSVPTSGLDSERISSQHTPKSPDETDAKDEASAPLLQSVVSADPMRHGTGTEDDADREARVRRRDYAVELSRLMGRQLIASIDKGNETRPEGLVEVGGKG